MGEYIGVVVHTEQAKRNTSVWKEHISDRNGVVIIRGNTLVDIPRKSHYEVRNLKTKSYLIITRYAHHNLCVT